MSLKGVLAELRKARGLTQEALAEQAHLYRTDIVNLESGRLRAGPKRLRRIADALEVDESELTGWSDEAAKEGPTPTDRLRSLEDELAGMKRARDRERQALARRLDGIEDALERAGLRPNHQTTGRKRRRNR